MTIEEAIQHCKEVATENRRCALEFARVNVYDTARNCQECAAEHEQLAEWLTELKQRREAEISTPPKANADRIRQMTDEELADILCFADCETGKVKCPAINNQHCNGDCCGHFLRWLKQEVKDDADLFPLMVHPSYWMPKPDLPEPPKE